MLLCGVLLNQGTFSVEFCELGATAFHPELDFLESDLPRLLQVQPPLLFSFPLFALPLFLRQHGGDLPRRSLFFMDPAGICLEPELGVF